MNSFRIIPAADLERETGLGKDLLRKWRARYGFPAPVRGASGEVGYSSEQIAQLRLIKRLQDSGFRPMQVVGKPLAELELLANAVSCAGAPTASSPVTQEALALLKQDDLAGLSRLLQRERVRQNLSDFVQSTVAPLTTDLGEAWARGEIEVYQEHLCTSLLARQLYADIRATTPRPGYPRIIFATPPGETHELGLLMAQAVLADQGVECINLGLQTAVTELVKAAPALGAAVVALSFSFAYSRRSARPLLMQLRRLMPETVAIWAGGAGVAEIRRAPPGIHIFLDLSSALSALQAHVDPAQS